MNMGFLAVFEVLIAVYLLYSAITGKGKVFENENLAIPREKYLKVMRILAVATGCVLLLSNGLAAAGVIPEGSVADGILWTAGFACILAMAVYSSKATRKGGSTPPGQEAGPKKDPLRAAFVFDDEEE